MAMEKMGIAVHACQMAGETIKHFREAAGLTLEVLAADVGISVSQLSRFESDLREPRVAEIRRIADRLGVDVMTLIDDRTNAVPIVGKVGLGEEIEYQGDGDIHLGEVALPFPAPPGCFALEATGQSQYPRIRDGELVVGRWSDRPLIEHVGREAIVKVRGGAYFIKTLRRGTRPRRFHLESHNAPLREDVEVERVGDLLMILPSRTWVREQL